jgi:hypothetical protein
MTKQQREFVRLMIASPQASATSVYRQVYPAQQAKRNPATERSAASRLLRSPEVVGEIDRALALDPISIEREALLTLAWIAEGKLDRRLERAARARLRVARIDLRRRAARERTRASDREQKRRAWKLFFDSARLLRANPHAALSPAEKTKLIFDYYRPAVPSAPYAGTVSVTTHPELADEIRNLVECGRLAQQAPPEEQKHTAAPRSFARPAPELATPLIEIESLWPAAPTSAGEWHWELIPGHFPARRRRVWRPSPDEQTYE